MRVVLDTNVIISALLWQGTAKEVFKLAKDNKITVCISKEILEEFQKVLHYPKFESCLVKIGKTPTELVNEFLEVVEYYPGEEIHVSLIPEDPSDNKILACAQAADASFIISGDKHLLQLKKFRNIPILSPKEFLKRI